MADGAVESSKARPGEDLLQGRINFLPAMRPLSTADTSSARNPDMEVLNAIPVSHRPAARSGAASSPVSERRSDGGEFHQRGLDPELSFEITFRRIGAGLANLGNTCFLNSVLQCLTYTEPFAAYLKSGKHKTSCRTAGFCAMCALQTHVMDALQSTGKILRPFHLVKNLRSISRNFRNARQEDAHEYMVNLLESMHKCCLPSGIASESPSAYEKSLVHKIFGGRLRSQVKCLQCSYCSNKFDPFLDLSLEIMKADTLHKALAHFTAVEQLDGGERQYQCQRCKQKVRAVKQLTIHKAPYVLTVHLKRFDSTLPGQKINKKVDFEPTLDLKQYVSDPCEGDLKYTLYGVLVHAGYATHSGHYYCFVRTSSGVWYSLNDDEVFQVSEKTVLQQKAYMLFYVRNMKSSAPKRTPDVVYKQKGLANSPGSKDPAVCSFVSKKANTDSTRDNGSKITLQGCPREGGMKIRVHGSQTQSVSEQCNSSTSKGHVSLGVSNPAKGMAMDEHLQKNTSFSSQLFVKSTHRACLSGEFLVNSLSKAPIRSSSATTTLFSSAIEHLAAESLIDKASPGDGCNQYFRKDMVLSVVSEEKAFSSLSDGLIQSVPGSGTLILANSLVKDCMVTLASSCHCQMKDFSAGSADVPPSCENRSVPHASSQHSDAKDGLTCDLTVNADKFNRLIHHAMHEDAKMQVTDAACKSQSSPLHAASALSNHSTAAGITDVRVSHVQQQDADVNDKPSGGPLSAEDLKCVVKEAGQVELFASNPSTSSRSRKDSVGCTKSCKLDMRRKGRKHALKGDMMFGPRRLFHAYLNLVKKKLKKKKHRRIEKQHIDIMEKRRGKKFLDVGFVLSAKRKVPESSWRENTSAANPDVIHCTKKHNILGDKNGPCKVEHMNTIRRVLKLQDMKNTRKFCTNSKCHHVSTRLLMSSASGMTDPPLMVASVSEEEPRIGCMSSEREKDCELRKKKKLKTSRIPFGGGNHFRDTTTLKTRKKMKIDWARSGNKPFRIHV